MEEAGLKLVAQGADQFYRDMDRAGQSVDDFGRQTDRGAERVGSFGQAAGGVGPILSGLGGIAVTAGAAIVGALAGAGAAAFDFASQTNQATNDFQASLGLTREEAEKLTDVARNVFGNNFGADIDDVTQSIITVRQQMKGLAEEDLQAITEGALAIRDVFGVEVAESTNAAGVLMDQFGLTGQQALDLITGGFQRGLNTSGDFLESITEYGGLFAQNGFSADEFFSTLETGLQGGVLGTDKIADAFKEFGIILQERPDTIFGPDGALTNDLGFTAEEATRLFDGLSDGSVTVADAYELILPKLAAMDDEVHRNSLGVALFGTMWEDMGADAMLAIDITKTGMSDLEGSTSSLNAKYTSLGAVGETMWRQTLLALEPLGELMLEIANGAMPSVLAGFEDLKGGIEVTVEVARNLAGALQGDKEALEALPAPLQAAAQGAADTQGAFEAFAASPWGVEIQQGAGVVQDYFANDFVPDLTNGIALVQQSLEIVAESDWWQRVQRGANVVGDFMANEFPARFQRGFERVNEWIQSGIRWLEDAATDYYSGATSIGSNIVAGIIAGLDGASGGLFSKITGIVAKALATAKGSAEIKSPSELFAREVGVPITQGIAEGVLSATDEATDALEKLGDDMEEKAKELAARITEAFKSGIDFLGAIGGSVGGLSKLQEELFKAEERFRAARDGTDPVEYVEARAALQAAQAAANRAFQREEQAQQTALQIGSMDPARAAAFLQQRSQQLSQVADLEERIAAAQAAGNANGVGLLQRQLGLLRERQGLELRALAQGAADPVQQLISGAAIGLLGGGGSSVSTTTNFNYSPTYGSPAPNPSQDFAAMRLMSA